MQNGFYIDKPLRDLPCKSKDGHGFGADGLCWYCDATSEAYDYGFYMGQLVLKEQMKKK